jgi:hypothetical protein
MPTLQVVGWSCDRCGSAITRIEDGWVEWLASDERGKTRLKGVRLVHTRAASPRKRQKSGCRYDAAREFHERRCLVEGLSLARFVGPDGLMLLLSFVASDEAPRNEVLELIKRVQIPGYEQAIPYVQQAITEGLFVPSIGNGFFLQSEIRVSLRRRAAGPLA